MTVRATTAGWLPARKTGFPANRMTKPKPGSPRHSNKDFYAFCRRLTLDNGKPMTLEPLPRSPSTTWSAPLARQEGGCLGALLPQPGGFEGLLPVEVAHG